MIKSKLLFTVTFLFFSLFNANAQKEKKVISLKIILQKISTQHNIIFNYIENEIVVYTLTPPQKEWSLETKIEYIKTETQLQFKLINNKYFTIYNDKKMDKPLCGFLLDSDTELPIENATIYILRTNISTSSNDKGYFELPTISPNTIQIKHLSYQSLTVNPEDLHAVNCPQIKLFVISEVLEEVVTQRYLTKGISKKNDGSFEIKPKKFGILPGLIEPDVLQTMQQIPGITSENETISNINVRGGTHDQNLFLWNGIRMFQTGHFFGLISAFNASSAQNINIVKNGSSAFYGESVSSLVAISSHSKIIEKSNNSVSANLISTEFYSKIKTSEKASFEFSGRRSLTDVFSSPTYKNYRKRIFQNTIVTNLNSSQVVDYNSDDNFYFYDFTAQYQQKIGTKHELSIDVIAIQNSLNINQYSSSESKNSDLGQQNLGGTINWKTQWNTNNWSQIYFYTSYYNLDSTNESIQNNQIFEQQNTILDMGFQLKNSHKISETIMLENGYQFNEIGVTNFDEINAPFFSRNSKEVLRNHALIVESNYKSKNKKTFLTTGIRANYFEKFKAFLLEPRIQFSQSVTENIRLEILGEQKNQTLSQIIDLQQDFLGIEKRRWTLANNSTIPIQKSNQISFGFTFKNKDWLVTVDNFYKKITGITSTSQGFQNQFEFIKTTGDYMVLGSEVLVQKNFKQFYSWVSYSFNDNNYLFDALSNTEFANNLELIHSVSWAGIYDWHNLKIALGSKWHSGKPFTTPSTNSVDYTDPANPIIEYNSPNSSRLKEYVQLNFSASKEWNLSKKTTMQTSISVLNILNTKNVINRFYRVNTSENTIESVDTYSLERTPNVNIKINF